ncbi:PDZ and LIM domain protein 7 [Melopsittacus undulatus]|uniref:PDZ and LIM domain protein 7 n=1 Tax=Melopsittacus undulatus TaxID=13146 RepID=UPI00146D26DF|nr:PDZ and LIM domain protein 7 [Melopsittacus undulatus]
MDDMESYKVMLNGPAPWGFRLQGGKDFSMPLSISRLTPGGKAAQAGVGVGDWVLYIDGESTSSMTHIEAQNRIRACGDRLSLTLSRAQNHMGKPQKDSLPCSEPLKYNFAPSTALNKTARPFGAGSPPNPRPGQPPQPLESPSIPVCDPGKLRLVEDSESWQPRTGTSQSRSFRKLARLTGTDSSEFTQDLVLAAWGCWALLGQLEPGRGCIVASLCWLCPHVPLSHGGCLGLLEDREDELVKEPRQPPQLLEPPKSPVCDPGKLRQVENAESWQPSSGTSQSRSFRRLAQLTGADSMEDHEDELVKEPRQPPEPLDPPRSPVCDPGKLRLMEDAEDWQPRTGTSQSRSFRKLAQLTGTDGLEDHEDVFVKKPSQVSVPDPSPGAGMKTEPGLAPRTPTATPGPASRPPWAVDPSFAERYAPDKTSTVVSKHSQPATPTPMQNRSSIVQAAQQAPEGPGRTPLCYKCNKVIRGRYLVALGHYYHPEEFTCCQCRKVLDEGGFFEEKGSIFCPKCYDTRYAPTCAKCKKKITGEVMHALKMTWHVQCFTCAACKTPIRNRAFYMEEGQPYCERDYEKMFGTKCRGCDFKIDAGDRFLEALGFSWHDTCFVCAICQTNLEGKTFYSKKDKPLCKSHAFSHV